jgi:hypothetical protein
MESAVLCLVESLRRLADVHAAWAEMHSHLDAAARGPGEGAGSEEYTLVYDAARVGKSQGFSRACSRGPRGR